MRWRNCVVVYRWGIPSVVLGYVGYLALVVYFHWGYSLGAGMLVLAPIVVPYIAKATQVSLRQVPNSYREGSSALGMTNSQKVCPVGYGVGATLEGCPSCDLESTTRGTGKSSSLGSARMTTAVTASTGCVGRTGSFARGAPRM